MNNNIFSRPPEEVVRVISFRTFLPGLFFLAAAVYSGSSEAALGLIFGLSISLLLFRLKLTHSRKALNMEKEKAKKFIRNRMVINYFIFFIVLAVAQWQPGLDLLAAALGLVLLKFTIIFSAVIELLKSFADKKSQEYSITSLPQMRKSELKEDYDLDLD